MKSFSSGKSAISSPTTSTRLDSTPPSSGSKDSLFERSSPTIGTTFENAALIISYIGDCLALDQSLANKLVLYSQKLSRVVVH